MNNPHEQTINLNLTIKIEIPALVRWLDRNERNQETINDLADQMNAKSDQIEEVLETTQETRP